MKIEKINIDDIKPYEGNAKLHPATQIEQIKESIREFGNNDPIAVDEDNVIIEGHGRYLALRELGFEEVEAIRLEGLTEEQKNAYRLVHNKLTMNSDFDMDMLEMELANIGLDMAKYNFAEIEEELEGGGAAEKPEVEFTKSVDENHNYIVLYFDNDVDWINALSLFEIKQAKNLSTKKDGKVGIEQIGVGRVIDGAKALSKLMGGTFGEDQR